MRIISGRARGKRLETIGGKDIRPTPDKVRGAIFNILFSRIGSLEGKKVLDLFAGSGAMALEALSRGAACAVLVDKGPEASRVIPKNLAGCGFADRGRLLRADVLDVFGQLGGEKPFDLVFLDPPYGRGLVEQVLESIAREGLLASDGLVCAEAARDDAVPASIGNLVRIDQRQYGSTAVHLFIFQEQGI